MSRTKKHHDHQLPNTLSAYAEERGINFKQFGEYHMRMNYDKIAIVDCWTTHKYWVKSTNYFHGITERGSETGFLPAKKHKLYDFLDRLFFAVEIKESE